MIFLREISGLNLFITHTKPAKSETKILVSCALDSGLNAASVKLMQTIPTSPSYLVFALFHFSTVICFSSIEKDHLGDWRPEKDCC